MDVKICKEAAYLILSVQNMGPVTERMQDMVREHITNPPRDGDLSCMLDPRNPIVFYSPGLRSFLAGVEPGYGFARKPEPLKPIMTAAETVVLVRDHLETVKGQGLTLGQTIDIAQGMHRDLRERYSVVKTPITQEEANKMVDDEMARMERSSRVHGSNGFRTDSGAEEVIQDLRKDILEGQIKFAHVIVG